MTYIKRSTFALLLTALLPAAAAAQDALTALDKASVSLRIALPNINTNVRADANNNAGTSVDFEKDLGIEGSNVVAYLGATWRPWNNHEFAFSIFNDSDATKHVLNRDIEFDGITYPVDSTVKAERKLRTYDLSYTWWAANHDTWALGPRVGVVYYNWDAKLDMTADATGNPVAGGTVTSEVSPSLPVPSIGAGWRWLPSKNWRLMLDAGYFNANFNDVDTGVIYLNAGLEWFPREHWGFSLNVSNQNIDASTAETDFSGDLDVRQSNASIGVTYRF
jgi:hypothetical protein